LIFKPKEVHFFHAGEDDDKPFANEIRGRVKDLGLENQFHFLGRRSDVPRLLTESDIFVLSSRREGHPFVLLEAMAGGCACVATRCAGVEDTVKDRETAFLVEIEDSSAMAAAVIKLVRDGELRKRLGSAARKEVRTRHDAKASVAALMSEYEEILSTSPPAAGSVAVDLFVRAAHELGSLGAKVTEMEERLRQVEHLAQNLRSNPIYASARRVKRWFRPQQD
jgi:glycosyltransferase involved in cell wall biosynthesis